MTKKFFTTILTIAIVGVGINNAFGALRIIPPPPKTQTNAAVSAAQGAFVAAQEAAAEAYAKAVAESLADLQVGEIISLVTGEGRTISTNHVFQKDLVCEDGVLTGKAAAITTGNGVVHVLGVGDITGVQLRLHMVDAARLGDKKFGLWVTEVPEDAKTSTTTISIPVVNFDHNDYAPTFKIDESMIKWATGELGDSWSHADADQDVESVYVILCDASDTPLLAARVAKTK